MIFKKKCEMYQKNYVHELMFLYLEQIWFDIVIE